MNTDFLQPAIELLHWFESIRNPVCDWIMHFFSNGSGSGANILILGLVMFWCFDKTGGYFAMSNSLFSQGLDSCIRNTLCIPRPWVVDPTLDVAEESKAHAGGYSFPSGHVGITTAAAGSWLVWRKWNIFIRIALWVGIAVAAVSRLYLGVHTIYDVSFSLIAVFVMMLITRPFFRRGASDSRKMSRLLNVFVILNVAALLYSLFIVPIFCTDSSNMAYAVNKTGEMLLGSGALRLVYLYDCKVRSFSIETRSWIGQILKIAVGLVLVQLIFRLPIWSTNMFGTVVSTQIFKYFTIVLFSGIIWPLTFPLFAAIPKIKLSAGRGKKDD